MTAATIERAPAAICGANATFPAERVGCGLPIGTCAEVYRCTDCSVPFHRDCANAHFRTSGDPSGSAEAMARALEWAWVIDREHADETDLAAALNSHGTITEKRGRAAERAEIVAWLRTVLKLNGPAQALADDIESRAHARGKEAQS